MTIRLTDPQADRYERLRLIRWWDQDRIRNARMLVLGAGALGNEVAKNLALIGAGKTYIVDFDKIETSNLTRSVLLCSGDVGQWKADATAGPILVNTMLTVIGVGRTFREDESPIWTVDFGGADDASCK